MHLPVRVEPLELPEKAFRHSAPQETLPRRLPLVATLGGPVQLDCRGEALSVLRAARTGMQSKEAGRAGRGGGGARLEVTQRVKLVPVTAGPVGSISPKRELWVECARNGGDWY